MYAIRHKKTHEWVYGTDYRCHHKRKDGKRSYSQCISFERAMNELLDEAKWLMIMAVVKNPEFIDHAGEDTSQQVYEFLKVLYDHDVEADVVVEALEKLKPLQEQSKEDTLQQVYEFLKVLYDHDVEADVVVEALEKLKPLQEQSKEDIYVFWRR